ncbi:methyl-accepting chemotaxis protein [Paenibacillus wynnii]|uniref:Chemotaxis protein n=1 Tax=Paenibacillus wynnii TaxID=268407 RepID=A0A098MA85_9BACL|nr:methyl-accepting chemotaxis protein [Paenibacillus wynnii]KGE18966.1 hypothetical protein PWYN_06090 [Paenibacillus wynnii]
MKIFQIKSLRLKILMFTLPMLLLTMTVLSWFTYQNSKQLINKEIETKMQYLLNSTIQEMQTKLVSHMKLPQTLARTVESAGDVMSKDKMYSLIGKYLTTNEETFGIGVWYEPYQYKDYLKFFGSYAYRFNGQILYSEDYNTESYNYPNQSWYKIAMDTADTIVWTDPYYDGNSKSTILTTAAPFYHFDGELRGVITANINFDHLQSIVSNIKAGTTGRALLVDKKGTYLFDKDKKKVLTANVANDSNESLSQAGKRMLAKPSGSTFYEDNGQNYRVYFQEVPETSWKLAMVIPESELFAPLNDLLVKSILIIAGAMLFVVILIYGFSSYLTGQIKKVNRFAESMAHGDFTNTIDIGSADELGNMSGQLNGMVLQLNGVLRKVYSSSDQVADTSVQLMLSTEQTAKAAEEISCQIQEVSVGSDVQVNQMNEANVKIHGTHERLKVMSDKMFSASSLIRHTLKQAQSGNEEIQEAVHLIQDVHSKTEESVRIIELLSAKSSEINKIVNLVSQISQRTTILALNAGIIASQSGTNGKAFAVVAQEIRGLAENSSEAGLEIQNLIREVQSEMKNAVFIMESSTKAVHSCKEKTESAGLSFDVIVSAVTEITEDTGAVGDDIGFIHSDMENLIEMIEKITEISVDSADRSTSVSAATEEQMASMQEISSSAAMLTDLAGELRRTVEIFRL